MLTHLAINHFAIIDQLNLDLSQGLTVVTGETGAGKSIIMDAIDLALGARANAQVIRQGQNRCDISVAFDISTNPDAQKWLQEEALDNENECIIRRVINRDGPSRLSINGQLATVQQAKTLAEQLIHIHGQHEHQGLLKRDHQLHLLDNFAGHTSLVNEVKKAYQTWLNTHQKLETLHNSNQDSTARVELLRYQVSELEKLNLGEDEYHSLDQEHKQLANAEELITACQNALNSISNNEGATTEQIYTAIHSIQKFSELDKRIKNASDALNQALIQLNESENELNDFLSNSELNPKRLNEVEQRISLIHDIARKHHVAPKEVYLLQQKLTEELEQLENKDQVIAKLEKELHQNKESYLKHAKTLSTKRKTAAEKLSKAVTQHIQQLGMPNGQFNISFIENEAEKPSPYGLEKAEFQVCANPGQALQPLNKVASGGEMSRIGLAIQVVTAQTTQAPTLIFDEVDVGIGGGTAEIVGKLLHELGEKSQILCITHLAQVASQGHHHLNVNKTTDKKTTETNITTLDGVERIKEIARMLGGLKITDTTLATAKEMLNA